MRFALGRPHGAAKWLPCSECLRLLHRFAHCVPSIKKCACL